MGPEQTALEGFWPEEGPWGFPAPLKFDTRAAASACARFLDSDLRLSSRQALQLLSILRETPPNLRARWWTEVRACRRRPALDSCTRSPTSCIRHTTSRAAHMKAAMPQSLRVSAMIADRASATD